VGTVQREGGTGYLLRAAGNFITAMGLGVGGREDRRKKEGRKSGEEDGI